ncbi:hypothetical protein MSC49_02280 [Methylosinus sp. C49]|uniref:hypothetical protein n=1 Tax=Methylosinus sp. C49 TaxID=2699395 RepID=UPI0013678619|nr:hypothetical protein [Methylosinus sp. C49]BBU60293.1 hypothetical protein MSC49_02280 [Methylosinus sp. C49]
MMIRPTVLLLTATVDPGAYAAEIARRDLEVRKSDYRNALRFFMRLPDARISGVVFCENSGADLAFLDADALRSETGRPLEIIGFDGNRRPEGLHYGYSELGIVDHACRSSRLLAQSERFFKVTGRLTFERLSALMDHLPEDRRFAADFRRAYSKEGGAPLRARTELMLFAKDFYLEHFFERRDEMIAPSLMLEEFFARLIAPLRGRGEEDGLTLRWPIECPASGHAARDNSDYDSAPIRAKRRLRALARVAAPWLWI